jgi:hypothetical protein
MSQSTRVMILEVIRASKLLRMNDILKLVQAAAVLTCIRETSALNLDWHTDYPHSSCPLLSSIP